MPNGYNGKILHLDLSGGTVTVETPPETFYRKYLGGSAMGLYYILRDTPPGLDAFDPANVLTFMLSVLTGAPISGQSRLTINARSPLTDGIGDSQGGGFFPAELKFAGFDGIVVKGASETPVYLWIKDGEYELRDASHLWGKTTYEVDMLLKEELGDDKIEIMQCGPAGERLGRMAAVMSMANRANGRTGMGAVMGSKKLKAIVVRGTSKRLPTGQPKPLNQLARWGAKNLENNGDMVGLRDHGTAGIVHWQNLAGGLPTHNYDAGQFGNYEDITGERMTATILTERDTCYACTVHCKRVVETEYNGEKVHPHYGGPEYETIATFGSYCGIDNLDAVALANQHCNAYGLDTIGVGATIAWAMDCYENGLLAEDEIGFPLPYGDAAAMVKMTKMIALREGFGDVLAEGSRAAADRLGKGHDLLITVKGAEAPAHMPQVKRSLGLIYAVNPFGADHQSSEHDGAVERPGKTSTTRLTFIGSPTQAEKRSLGEAKVGFAFKTQVFYSFLDSANLCQFVYGPSWTLYGPEQALEAVQHITGWDDFTVDEIMAVGERRLNMLRLFNAREGLTREQDKLPRKFYKALREGGPSGGRALDPAQIEQGLDIYYGMCGWDVASGNPTFDTLERLGLAEFAEAA